MKAHVHYWKVNDSGLGNCSVRNCPVKTRQFRDYRAPRYDSYLWNSIGFASGGTARLQLPPREDESY